MVKREIPEKMDHQDHQDHQAVPPRPLLRSMDLLDHQDLQDQLDHPVKLDM
jgi:hypothetical protein